MRQSLFTLLTLASSLFFVSQANAVLRIEITEGVVGATPIAIVPFGWNASGSADQDMAAIIERDLELTGKFSPIKRADFEAIETPHKRDQVLFANWKALGVDNLVIAEVVDGRAGQVKINFELFDVYRETALLSYSLPAARKDLRVAAHHISDFIYKELTGECGAFNTQIAYVSVYKRSGTKFYELIVADADGENDRVLVRSVEPIMSPAWAPDGESIAYVTFDEGASSIRLRDLATGEESIISQREGINGAPAFSPDGKKLALTLSTNANSDIYVYDLNTRVLKQITRNPAIDTEPSWHPSGKRLAFTSDRGGKPQVYSYNFRGGKIQRLSFEGRENARPRYSPKGNKLAMVTRESKHYRVAMLNLETQSMQILSRGRLDESPSFSPNSAVVIYSNNDGKKSELAAVSVDGSVRQRLSGQRGEIREPVWGPYINSEFTKGCQ